MERKQIVVMLMGDWHPDALQENPAFDSFVALVKNENDLPPEVLRRAWLWFQAGWHASP